MNLQLLPADQRHDINGLGADHGQLMQHLDPNVGRKTFDPQRSRIHADASAFQKLDIGHAYDFAARVGKHPRVLRVP
ncbi:hypothetical protein D3C85_1508560 [compost metagenome]